MQYTYEEAVREISDFIGKNATADNYWKMEQVLLTVLRRERETYSDFDRGYDTGYEDAKNVYTSYGLGQYKKGYVDGLEAARDTSNAHNRELGEQDIEWRSVLCYSGG